MARSLVEETMLFDPDNAGFISQVALVRNSIVQAIYFTWNLRSPIMKPTDRQTILAAIQPVGLLPSPIAMTPWADPTDPLLLDISYAQPYSSLEADWSLAPDAVNRTPADPASLAPPPRTRSRAMSGSTGSATT